MARFKITNEFRSHLSEKLMDLGNLVAGALVLGQFIAGKEFSVGIFFIGIIMTISCYTVSLLVAQ